MQRITKNASNALLCAVYKPRLQRAMAYEEAHEKQHVREVPTRGSWSSSTRYHVYHWLPDPGDRIHRDEHNECKHAMANAGEVPRWNTPNGPVRNLRAPTNREKMKPAICSNRNRRRKSPSKLPKSTGDFIRRRKRFRIVVLGARWVPLFMVLLRVCLWLFRASFYVFRVG